MFRQEYYKLELKYLIFVGVNMEQRVLSILFSCESLLDYHQTPKTLKMIEEHTRGVLQQLKIRTCLLYYLQYSHASMKSALDQIKEINSFTDFAIVFLIVFSDLIRRFSQRQTSERRIRCT